MTECEAFIEDILNNPLDHTPRLIFADWLEEHDDLRGAFLRVTPTLRQVPWREGLRPDCKVWFKTIVSPRGNPDRIEPRVDMPELKVGTLKASRAGSVGRLLGTAMLWETLLRIAHLTPEQRSEYSSIQFYGQQLQATKLLVFADEYNQKPWRVLFQALARYELYACGLLPLAERDLVITTTWNQANGSWINVTDRWAQDYYLVRPVFGDSFTARVALAALKACRKGRFGSFCNCMRSCETLLSIYSPADLRNSDSRGDGAARQWKEAYFRGRSLDLVDRFWQLGVVDMAHLRNERRQEQQRTAWFAQKEQIRGTRRNSV